MRHVTNDELPEVAVALIETIVNGYVTGNHPDNVQWDTRLLGFKLTEVQALDLLNLIREAVVVVAWPQPDGPYDGELCESDCCDELDEIWSAEELTQIAGQMRWAA